MAGTQLRLHRSKLNLSALFPHQRLWPRRGREAKMAGMRRFVAIGAIGALLVVLAPFCAVNAGPPLALKPPPPPPPPRPVVHAPVVQPSQQLSFWGVDTNLQRSRDEWQGAQGSRTRSQRLKAQSDDWQQW
jgi:hypothetical protein